MTLAKRDSFCGLFTNPRLVHMGIYHRCAHVFVPEQLLDQRMSSPPSNRWVARNAADRREYLQMLDSRLRSDLLNDLPNGFIQFGRTHRFGEVCAVTGFLAFYGIERHGVTAYRDAFEVRLRLS